MSPPKLDCEQVRVCSIVRLPASLIMSRRACVHMLPYLHVYIVVCVCVCVCACVVWNLWWRPYVLSCGTQTQSSLSFLPGPVLVFRAPPEGPLARWERCWRRPGPAALLPSPSAGCQAQRVPVASQAWRWGCLHSQRRVWTGQGVATSCRTHTHTQEGPPSAHTHAHLHKAGSWWVRHMFGRCCRGECAEPNLEHLLRFVRKVTDGDLRIRGSKNCPGLTILTALVLYCYRVVVDAEKETKT